MSKRLKADLMLLVVTLCWGISYYLMDISLADMGPFTLNAHRFLLAFAIAFVLALPKFKKVSRTTLKYSVLLGLALVLVYAGVTFGVQYTTLSNAGFLCGLTVIFTPILSWIIYKKSPSKKVALVVLLCVTGIAFLTLTETFSIDSRNLLGDLLCIFCAFIYAFHLLITEKAVSHPDVNPFQIGVLQLGFAGVLNFIMAWLTETPHLPSNSETWISVLFLSIFCTGLAFIIQAIAQQYTSASHVGVIFSLEPVFAGVVAFFLAHEILTPRAYFGAFLMVLSIFIMEIDFRSLLRKR